MADDARWYEGVFEGGWLDTVLASVPPERTAAEADFVVERLAPQPGARILDLGCGRGRHVIELARRGYRVAGLDLGAGSLALAREAAAAEGLDVGFVRGDMRDLPFEAEFDAVISMWTAFGYFDTDAEDRRVLEAVHRALVPGGRFLVETANILWVIANFRARAWREFQDGTALLESRRYDAIAGRMEGTWRYVRPDGGTEEQSLSLRSYTAPELARMVESAGMEVDGFWGSFDGAPYDKDARRMILVARRPAPVGV